MAFRLFLPFVCALLFVTTGQAAAGEDSTAHAALFAGATVHHGHAASTLGVEGEYYVPGTEHILGVGPLFESVFDTHTIGVAAALITVHPLAGLRVFFGPGVEYVHAHAAFLTRAGAGYDFHLGDFSLSPLANLDYLDGDWVQVYGLAVGLAL